MTDAKDTFTKQTNIELMFTYRAQFEFIVMDSKINILRLSIFIFVKQLVLKTVVITPLLK